MIFSSAWNLSQIYSNANHEKTKASQANPKAIQRNWTHTKALQRNAKQPEGNETASKMLNATESWHAQPQLRITTTIAHCTRNRKLQLRLLIATN